MKFDKGLSERAVARSLSLSAGAVNGYLHALGVGGPFLAIAGPVDDTASRRLCLRRPHRPAARPVPDWTVWNCAGAG